ncbi:MAG: hypothetical protein L3J20_04530 [Flavobacteriaceae bacterium]|nr:hypothetical protein [Flavobacteriaceae bacterium]
MMKSLIGSLLFLLVWNFGFSQELSSEKEYDFAKLFEEIQNDNLVFEITFSQDKSILSFFKSQIIFPLVEEKEMMNFNKGNRQKEFTPKILFDNIYQKPPNFTIDLSNGQQAQGNHHKILKGYDYCGRPIY